MDENISTFFLFVLMFFEKLLECFQLIGCPFEADFFIE